MENTFNKINGICKYKYIIKSFVTISFAFEVKSPGWDRRDSASFRDSILKKKMS